MTQNQNGTPAKSPSSKSKNRAANQAAIAQISELYPNTFNREAVKPLKIGIQEDLLVEEKLSKGKIKRALASYVRAPAYYKSLVEGAERVDLKGEPAGIVTAQEAEHAKKMLKQQRDQRQQRIAQEKQNAKEERLNNKLAQLITARK